MLRERLEVLHDSSEVELVARAAEAPQAHALEAVVGLEVREAHFDSLPLIAGSLVLRRFHESTRDVASLFVDVPGYFAPGDVRTTPRLQRASIAIELARPIEDRSTIVNSAGRTQGLAVRAAVLILLFVEGEVAAREGSIIPFSLLLDRDVRGDAGTNEPSKELTSSVGCVRQEAFGLQAEPSVGALDHRPSGLDLVVRARRCRLDVDDHRVLDVDQVIEPVAELHALVGLRCPGRTRVGRRDHLRWCAIGIGIFIAEACEELADSTGLPLRG